MYFYPLSNHLGSLKNLFESVCAFKVKSEFAKKRGNWSTWRKYSQSKNKNQQQTYGIDAGIQTQAHLWEANALTTTPPLHSTHQWGIYIKGGPKGINDQLRDSLGTHDSLKG